MLKGSRTYISLVLTAIATVLPTVVQMDPDINKALIGVCLALAAYFRNKA